MSRVVACFRGRSLQCGKSGPVRAQPRGSDWLLPGTAMSLPSAHLVDCATKQACFFERVTRARRSYGTEIEEARVLVMLVRDGRWRAIHHHATRSRQKKSGYSAIHWLNVFSFFLITVFISSSPVDGGFPASKGHTRAGVLVDDLLRPATPSPLISAGMV